ncbi:Arginine transport ATP-binding protein ArtM [Pseudoruegeria aquimaris]|uniref:Arginine transport ATP-binding protein ArtM n=1 Tax=Pseudoruegeria aquimaris TaxID=393663 RepID=A0A1Y5S471_9RHOB|nr:ATP-binding cassette domain-containing protein [Pseudoruegeria aquimaris]SLN29408.1 Arginine transport ATP-binding protein ArtM [Pseudoruegeria aquimaris]
MVAPILPLTLSAAIVKRQGRRLIGPVDCTIEAAGTTIVMGPNGSGKTTLLRLMHGLERAREGRVAWAVDEPATRAHQAYVFQTPIMMRRSVVECIAYPLLTHGTGRREARARAEEWAARVGLGDALGRMATVLSGGEKQKLALARALIRRPQVLFLDEPCANLDGRATREIESILAEARADGVRIVMSTHDMGQARRLADDVLFLLNGRIHEAAMAWPFFAEPATPEARAFLKGDIVE